MKKVYIKPGIIFDSFEMTQSIAAGCELIQQNQAEGSCPVLVPEWSLNYLGKGCDLTPPSGNDGLCYHVPIADNNVYTS